MPYISNAFIIFFTNFQFLRETSQCTSINMKHGSEKHLRNSYRNQSATLYITDCGIAESKMAILQKGLNHCLLIYTLKAQDRAVKPHIYNRRTKLNYLITIVRKKSYQIKAPGFHLVLSIHSQWILSIKYIRSYLPSNCIHKSLSTQMTHIIWIPKCQKLRSCWCYK